MSENNGDPRHQLVPRLYVDAADVRVQPHSLHLILGQLNLEGEPEPSVHITMSPSFAVEVSRALAAAVQQYLADPEHAPGPPAHDEQA